MSQTSSQLFTNCSICWALQVIKSWVGSRNKGRYKMYVFTNIPIIAPSVTSSGCLYLLQVNTKVLLPLYIDRGCICNQPPQKIVSSLHDYTSQTQLILVQTTFPARITISIVCGTEAQVSCVWLARWLNEQQPDLMNFSSLGMRVELMQ